MSLTNPKDVVTEERLNEYHNTILPYLGGMPDVLANKFAKGDLHSTDEKMIGCWTDGKPLYQKVVNFGALPNNTLKEVDSGLSDVNIKDMYGVAFSSNGFTLTVPHNEVGDSTGNVDLVYTASNKIRIKTDYDYSAYTAYITLQYTKTNDATVNIGNDTDYSTEEKIVGTWVDGKPIWQKTFSTTAPNASANGSYAYKTIDHNIQNLNEFCEIKGVITSDAFSSVLPFFTDGGNKVKFNIDATQISIANDATYCNGKNLYITVQYTKSS